MKHKSQSDIYDSIVKRVLVAFAEPLPFKINDDMDDWLASQGLTTYTESYMAETTQRISGKKSARKELMDAGSAALPAVRKGLRRIAWLRGREVLLEFMKKYGGAEEDRETLRLISVRRRDPLSKKVRNLLNKWGEDISELYPEPRTTPTATEAAYEKKVCQLLELCRQPTKVRDMMCHLNLSNRKNFTRNYLNKMKYRRGLIEYCGSAGTCRDCYKTTRKGIKWLKQRSPAD